MKPAAVLARPAHNARRGCCYNTGTTRSLVLQNGESMAELTAAWGEKWQEELLWGGGGGGACTALNPT